MTSPLVKPAAGYRILSRLESSRSRPSIDTMKRSPAIVVLLHGVLRGLVVTQPHEPGEAQASVGGLVAVADLDHQLGAYPAGAFRVLAWHGAGRERRLPGGERFESVEQLLLGGAADPAADPAAEGQALRGGHADQQATQLAGAGP